MAARLVALGDHPDIVFEESRPIVTVGRDPGCDVRLKYPGVSRRHCCLVLIGDDVMVRDLGSRNGTRVNGERVPYGLLNHGDVLTVATLAYRAVSKPSYARTTASHPIVR